MTKTNKHKKKSVSICSLCNKHNLKSLSDCPVTLVDLAKQMRWMADALDKIVMRLDSIDE